MSAYFHCVFGTKGRLPTITLEIQDRLWRFMGGIARQNDFKTLEIGGVADHVHLLVSLRPTMDVAKAMQLIKGGSSKWVHETFPVVREFAWQKKYGAFSVSVSQLDVVRRYIRGQEEHPRTVSFQDEFVALLKKHGIDYDERYLWE